MVHDDIFLYFEMFASLLKLRFYKCCQYLHSAQKYLKYSSINLIV